MAVQCLEGKGLFCVTQECQLQRHQEKEHGYLENGLVTTLSGPCCLLWWLQLWAYSKVNIKLFCYCWGMVLWPFQATVRNMLLSQDCSVLWTREVVRLPCGLNQFSDLTENWPYWKMNKFIISRIDELIWLAALLSGCGCWVEVGAGSVWLDRSWALVTPLNGSVLSAYWRGSCWQRVGHAPACYLLTSSEY